MTLTKLRPKVVIIIVGYNSAVYLPDCLNSLRNQTFRQFQVFFVDNASTDQSHQVVDKYPEVRTIFSKENLGFAAANNLAIAEALKGGANYIWLLNPDTVVDKNALAELLKTADERTILQPVILLHSNPKKINTDGNLLHYLGFSYCGHYREDYRSGPIREITLASGAAFFAPTSMFKKVGFLDGRFFMYHEDVDLSWRARLQGFTIKVVPSSRIWHHYSFSRNANKIFYAERNRLLFLVKNYQVWTLLLIFPTFFINELAGLIYASLTGQLLVKLRTYGSFFCELPKTLQARQKVQSQRQVSDRKLARLVVGRLDFPAVRLPFAGLYNFLVSGYWQIIKEILV